MSIFNNGEHDLVVSIFSVLEVVQCFSQTEMLSLPQLLLERSVVIFVHPAVW